MIMSLICVAPVVVNAAGTGTENDPILLTAADFKAYEGVTLGGKATFEYYKLTEDVILDKPIKNLVNASLDGDGHTVTLNITSGQQRWGWYVCIQRFSIKAYDN